MNVVIAMDSFKGSMTSLEAGTAAAAGIQKAYPDAKITIRPLADGGEGTVAALTDGNEYLRQTITVTGPAKRPVTCTYGIREKSHTAVLEIAQIAGITLISNAEKNPLNTTTYGIGEVILDAFNKGCRNFIIGIGGSATNDGGIGMLQALGFDMLDKNQKPVPSGCVGASVLASISAARVLPELMQCTFRIACDVTAPLCGRNGCSAVFGPQKGADSETIPQMDTWLAHYADIAKKYHPSADPDLPGSGAAGGLGFAFRTFLQASLESGIQIILEETKLESYIQAADIVVTGEGRLDGQTVMGKAPAGVADIAKKYQKPVLAFSGSVSADASACNNAGINAFFPILQNVVSLEEAMKTEVAMRNMASTTEQVFRAVKSCSTHRK